MFLSVLHCHMVLLIYKFLNISVEISLYICIFWNVVILVAPIQNTSVSSSSLPETEVTISYEPLYLLRYNFVTLRDSEG